VVDLEAQQQELAKDLNYVMSEGFVEKEAREKLLMSKPGEVVVLLPPEEERDEISSENFDEEERELENWEKWVRLFL
jgi:hypothetical protein